MANKRVVAAHVQTIRRRRNKRIADILTIWQQEHPGEAIEPHVLSPWAIARGLDKKPPNREEMLRREIAKEIDFRIARQVSEAAVERQRSEAAGPSKKGRNP